ncbi:hypothetical protein GDO81_013144 [Engystomops pustulosus]|uniref:SWIM-type domain-containing protein n=1 Tax=Engystomops pustulosus TaxID=76066 RepID=A0AAV7B1S5_ENGPU|nr:hypothetical protein GDO81_013144 [Engystomops pustulosus]
MRSLQGLKVIVSRVSVKRIWCVVAAEGYDTRTPCGGADLCAAVKLLRRSPSPLLALSTAPSTPVIATKHPFKVDLKAGKLYPWCSCGHSKKQIMECRGVAMGFRGLEMAYTDVYWAFLRWFTQEGSPRAFPSALHPNRR